MTTYWSFCNYLCHSFFTIMVYLLISNPLNESWPYIIFGIPFLILHMYCENEWLKEEKVKT